MKITAADIFSCIEKIREKAPLVHNITNFVVMNTTANALLAIGASPVMAHAIHEVEEMVSLSKALVINIGTLSPEWVEAMLCAARKAKDLGIPVVFDPVGAGATVYRTGVAGEFLEAICPEIIRGNASEILALAGCRASTKGVDSTDAPGSALDAARSLNERYGSVVSVSGAIDHIIEGTRVARVSNGHPMMTRVTGMGCCATALSGAFACVNEPFLAATMAMAFMGVAGELAVQQSAGPGSLQVQFLDVLYEITLDDIERMLKLEVSL